MKGTSIRYLNARQVLDGKGVPTLEVDVFTEGGAFGRAAAPCGLSAGEHESFVLRDGDPGLWRGQSVFRAAAIVKDVIEPALAGMDVMEQMEIDSKLIALDGTHDKSRLGGNTIYCVSLACLRAAAFTVNTPLYIYLAVNGIKTLPVPTFCNIVGGSYEKGTMPFQEITVVPYKAKSIQEAAWIGCELYDAFPGVIRDFNKGAPAVKAQGAGWQSPSPDPIVAFDITYEACARVGIADKVAFSLDCASSELYDPDTGLYNFIDRKIDTDELISVVQDLTTKYPFMYVEDVLSENDWEGWQKARKALTRTRLIGDDLTVTNPKRLRKARELDVIDGFIFKPNQVGTMTESVEAINFAQKHGWMAIPSSRHGGVIDDVIYDFLLAFNCPCTKSAPPKRAVSYGINNLLRAENMHPGIPLFDLGSLAKF